ncbi:hypothetical protein FANTH_9799 [Fusarium anthophilum]|uniref:DUF6546 domain-containing protein n=1 Tax=Fusarium anthophilum TaxID=48485 RepID=A0A8H4Z4V5_9HYPO|nr:hypothetical protein FANTH_9799 [Fusarium anthophilum]
MPPRTPKSLRGLVAITYGTRWATNPSFDPKSPSSPSSPPRPKTASIRLYEKLKRYKELERKYEEQRKIMEESNVKGTKHSLEGIEFCITLTKWLREQAQEDYDNLSFSVRRLIEFRRLTGEYAARCIYSPSDAQHWFPYLTFVPDSPSNRLEGSGLGLTTINQSYHDPPHGWVDGFRHSAPPPAAVNKAFHYIMEHEALHSDQSEFEWWNQLPSVSSVTSILLRQQNRRRWEPIALAPMLARFPRLQEIHYEPWRRWDIFQPTTDKVFMQRFLDGEDLAGCESIRKPAPAVGRMIALTSLPLEHLAASFIIDASHFFAIDPSWEWPNLTSLVLTSRLLKPEDDSTKIDALLQAAAAAALKMPRLETMEIWNGQKGLAALFQYRMIRGSRQARILWRGTWKYHITLSVIQAWEAVGNLHASWRLDVVQEPVEKAAIQSHGDALHHLMLSGQAIRSVSLQQIRKEQKFLEGVEVVS